VRIKGGSPSHERTEERIEPGTEYSRRLQTGTAFQIAGCCLLLKRPGPGGTDPHQGFFLLPLFVSFWYQCSVIMKTLLLLRHAKAENAAPGSSDINRALNERGKKEAQAIGTFIRKQNLTFDLVLCSPAVRARETAELVLAAAEVTANVRYDQRIYEAGPRQLLEVISEVVEDKSGVLLVGHNPVMEELLRALTGAGEPMATGTLARIDFDFDQWSRVTEDTGALKCIVRPNELASG